MYHIELQIENMIFDNKIIVEDQLSNIFYEVLTPAKNEVAMISKQDHCTLIELRDAYLSLAKSIGNISTLEDAEKKRLIKKHLSESYQMFDKLLYLFKDQELNRKDMIQRLLAR